MNKFKKILLTVLIVTGIGCLVGLTACAKPDYYKLTFEGTGIDYILQDALSPEEGDVFLSGGTVKAGVEVKFTISVGSNVVGTPVILLNGQPLTPDENNVYSFIMSSESVVSVQGLNKIVTVTMDKTQLVSDGEGGTVEEELWIDYLDESGKEMGDSLSMEAGQLKFKLKLSPYYKRISEDGAQPFTVSCNTEELTPDADGYYVADVLSDSTISVSGLNLDKSFLERNEGNGSAEDPYIIRKPIDLFNMAAFVNSEFYTTFSYAHYSLEADIDMEGEKLFVIGDASNENAMFCGTFAGNGHKISNFYITDEVISQTTFEKAFLPYVGLFGFAGALVDSPAKISDLTLENYEIEVHTGDSEEATYAGSLLGFGIGVEITNCRASGEILATGNDNKIIYLGGLAGLLQSAYRDMGTRVVTYDSYVYGSSTDVVITGIGTPMAAGGIVGRLITADINAIAYVANSYSTGPVTGAMHTGGIVGTLGKLSSVTNCYSTSAVSAANGIANGLVSEEYKVAYAGGIAGYAENDTVISSCYSANADISAHSDNGAKYQKTGDFVGFAAASRSDAIDSEECIAFNCIKSSAGDNKNVFTNQLGWFDEDWNFDGELPQVSLTGAKRDVNITVMANGATVAVYPQSLAFGAPVYKLYLSGKLPQYVTKDSGRSWGYYFDDKLTQKVPYGYVPYTSNIALYAGLADYSEVAGRYYFRATDYSQGAYIELDADGNALFRDGGMVYNCTYTYDGNEICVLYSCLASMLYTANEINGMYYTVEGVKTENGFSFVGKGNVIDLDNSTETNTSFKPAQILLTAVKEVEGFGYGEYVDESGVSIFFDKEGTGSYGRTEFTYVIGADGKSVTLSDNREVTVGADGKVVSVGGKSVSLKDKFAGTWQASALSSESYKFDGLGGVKYTNKGVVTDGTYQLADEKQATITLNGNTVDAKFGADGALVIDGRTTYRADGAKGRWYSSADSGIELELEGVGLNGYGNASITYTGGSVYSVPAQYDTSDSAQGMVIRVFVDDIMYGELIINSATGVASGSFYSLTYYKTFGTIGYVSASFNLYDALRGNWICEYEGLNSITFTGKSLTGEAQAWVEKSNGSTAVGNYSVVGDSYELTLENNVYVLAYDERTDLIQLELKDGQQSGISARRDGWYGVTLYDGNTSYTFDGRGYLGGSVTKESASERVTLEYTVDGNGVITMDGKIIEANGDSFLWNGVKLAFKTGFAGSWTVGGCDVLEKLEIGEVNADFTAAVNADGEEFTAVYSPAEKTLSFSAFGSTVVMELNSFSPDEGFLQLGGLLSGEYTVIKSELIDSYRGDYTAADGSYWAFDGFGNSRYGSGTVEYMSADGEVAVYCYEINELGAAVIVTGPYKGYVFVEKADGKYVRDGKHYESVLPDALYLKEAQYNGGIYVFDGVETIYRETEAGYEIAYTYEHTETANVLRLESKGRKYYCQVKTVGQITTLDIQPVS